MNSRPKCCVPSCSNTWELTRDRIVYYRFPTNKDMKQKWLDAIKWYNGNPGCNHYVCADHFDVEDLSVIDENTNIVPTIFNPEFVEIKTESELFNSSILTISNEELLDVERIKKEIDDDMSDDFGRYEIIELPTLSDNEIDVPSIKTEITHDDIELGCYQIIDTPEVSDNETPFPIKKKMKIENSSLNVKPTNGVNTKQSVDNETPKITKVDLSKVRLKIVTSTSDEGTKTEVKAVPVKSDDQLRHITSTPKTACREWKDNETREFIRCMLKYKNKFRQMDIRKESKFWKEIEAHLNERRIIRQPITVEDLIIKWSRLVELFDNVPAKNSTIFPFTHEIKILLNSVNLHRPINNISSTITSQTIKTDTPTNPTDYVDQLPYRYYYNNTNGSTSARSSSISENETNFKLSKNIDRRNPPKRIEWIDKDTRIFLKCLLKHRDEFLKIRKRKKIMFWKKMVGYLKQEGKMTRLPTVSQIINKWKKLMNKYQQRTSSVVDRKLYPFIDEMKEILFDSLDSESNVISIGIKSFCQSINDESIYHFNSMNVDDNDANTQNTVVESKITYISSDKPNNKTEPIITKDRSKDSQTAVMAELKQIYLKKKIEGRDLKNKLLSRLLNDPNCNIITTGFRLVKANKS